jgi:hypothetical protein
MSKRVELKSRELQRCFKEIRFECAQGRERIAMRNGRRARAYGCDVATGSASSSGCTESDNPGLQEIRIKSERTKWATSECAGLRQNAELISHGMQYVPRHVYASTASWNGAQCYSVQQYTAVAFLISCAVRSCSRHGTAAGRRAAATLAPHPPCRFKPQSVSILPRHDAGGR